MTALSDKKTEWQPSASIKNLGRFIFFTFYMIGGYRANG